MGNLLLLSSLIKKLKKRNRFRKMDILRSWDDDFLAKWLSGISLTKKMKANYAFLIHCTKRVKNHMDYEITLYGYLATETLWGNALTKLSPANLSLNDTKKKISAELKCRA